MYAIGKKKEEGMGEKERNMETTVKTTISAMDSVTIKEAVRLIRSGNPKRATHRLNIWGSLLCGRRSPCRRRFHQRHF